MKNKAFYAVFSFSLYDRLKNFILVGRATFARTLKAFNVNTLFKPQILGQMIEFPPFNSNVHAKYG